MFEKFKENWRIWRRRKNILTDRPMQLKFAMTFTLVFFAVFIVLSSLYLFFIIRVLNLPILLDIQEIKNLIADQWLAFVCVFLAVTSLPFAVAFSGVLLTHRIVGPFVPINRHMRALVAGDYGQGSIRIRKKDYIHPFVSLLNLMVEAVKQREEDARLCLEEALGVLDKLGVASGSDKARVDKLSETIRQHVETMRDRTVKKGPLESYDGE